MFDPSKKWEGYFAFEIIELTDKRLLDDIWMLINGKKITPTVYKGSNKSYLYFYVSNDLFPYTRNGEYVFSPKLQILVPNLASPGRYDADIFFTLIQ